MEKKNGQIYCTGPPPFTPAEEKIIETRRQIEWRVLGIESDGNHIFEITNTSGNILPVLTVGVRSKSGRLNGAVILKIGNVGPGQTAILRVDCYKDMSSPYEIEIFNLPDPLPEDREFYSELRPGRQPAAADK